LNRFKAFSSVHRPALLGEQAHGVEAPVQQAGGKLWVEVEPLEGVDRERKLCQVVPVQLLNSLAHCVSGDQNLEVIVVKAHFSAKSHFSLQV